MKRRKYFIYIVYSLFICYSLIGILSCAVVLLQHLAQTPEQFNRIEGEINQQLAKTEIMRVDLLVDVIQPIESEIFVWGIILTLSIVIMMGYCKRHMILEKYIKYENCRYAKNIGEIIVFLSLVLFWYLTTVLTKNAMPEVIFGLLTDDDCLLIEEGLKANDEGTIRYSLFVIKRSIALALNIGGLAVASSFLMAITWFFRGRIKN